MRSRGGIGRSLATDGGLLVAAGVVSLSYGAVFPLLAGLRDAFGLPLWGLGVLAGAAFAGSLATQLLLAPFADRGRSRLMLAGGLAVTALGLLWFGLAGQLWAFVAARTLMGAGEGLFLPAARRILILRHPRAAGAALGRLTSATLVGFVVGPLLSAALAEWLGLRGPFVAIGVAVAAFVPLAARLEVPSGPVVRRVGLSLGLLRIPGVRTGVLAAVGLWTSIGTIDAVWALYVADRGGGKLFTGASLALFGAVMAAVAPLGGRLADRRSPLHVSLAALLASVPCIIAYGLLGSLVAIGAVLVVHACCDAVSTPGVQSAVATASGPERVAAGQGLVEAVGLAVATLAAVAATPLYGLVGPAWLFAGVGASITAIVATTAALDARTRGHASSAT